MSFCQVISSSAHFFRDWLDTVPARKQNYTVVAIFSNLSTGVSNSKLYYTTEWTNCGVGVNNAILCTKIFSIGVFPTVCNHHYNELYICCLQNVWLDWSKIGRMKDTCLHHSMLPLFLVSLCTAPTPFIIFGVLAAT